MTTLCVDIGLRNLSMCIMDHDYRILLWDVFNVLDSDDHHCEQLCKSGKMCGKKCTMKYSEKKSDAKCDRKDSKAKGNVSDAKGDKKSDRSVSDAKGNVSSDDQKESSEVIFTCKTHFPKDIVATKANTFSVKKIDEYLLQDIALAFVTRIDAIVKDPVFQKLTSILIELQPKINRKAIFTSHILYGKLVDLYTDRIPIRFVRASQKLKSYTGPPITCHLKGAYAQRKWLSIEYCKWFLQQRSLFSVEQEEQWLPFFVAHRKKDDLADCMLMCMNSVSPPKKKSKKAVS